MPSFMPKKTDPLHLVGLGANRISTLTTPRIYRDVMPLLTNIDTGTIRVNNLETVIALLA